MNRSETGLYQASISRREPQQRGVLQTPHDFRSDLDRLEIKNRGAHWNHEMAHAGSIFAVALRRANRTRRAPSFAGGSITREFKVLPERPKIQV